jgi:putative ABC transport system ATP-binding protein
LKPAIDIRDLHKTYSMGSVPVSALRGIDMRIGQGEFVAIVGRSGSGKSTLLNIIGGLDRPTSGRAIVEGRDLAAMNRKALAQHRRHSVGMIFQSFNLIPSRTALENVTLALAFGGTPRKDRKSRAKEVIDTMGLLNRAHHRPGELSGGEAQRIAIARALANRPGILLADEPTGNLDSKTSGEIISLIESLNEKGMTIIMVTHDETSAARVADRTFSLLDGKVVEIKERGS